MLNRQSKQVVDQAEREVLDKVRGLDWRLEAERNDVRVFSAHDSERRVRVFRTDSQHRVTLAVLADYLGSQLVSAMARMNVHSSGGAWLEPLFAAGPGEPQYGLVKTLFRLPMGLQPREFLHLLKVFVDADGQRAHVTYAAAPNAADIAVESGYLRCPIYPSGQIMTVDGGVCLVQHFMSYHLGGAIHPWVQDQFFRRGHVQAYLGEWQRLGEHLEQLHAKSANERQSSTT